MKKKILIGTGIGILVVIAAVAIIVGFFLGDVVKAGMNTVGPKVTQTVFFVDSVGVSPLTGSVSLNKFVLGNPEDYLDKASNCITAGKIAVSVAPLSVLSDKMQVKNVEVHDAEIFFVGNPIGANNLKKIQANVDAFTSSLMKPSGTNAANEKKSAKKLEVDNFLITGAKVHFNGAVLTLPDIHLTNLGTGPDGITPAELFKDVLNDVTTATLKAVIASAGDAGKALGGEASKIGKGIGGLFKK